MQAKRITTTQKRQLCLALLALTLTALDGCGGGTTGTSSGDTFKLVGVAEDAQRATLPRTEMSVASGATNQILVNSETDERGTFSMQLPGEEESLVAEVGGVRSTPLSRKLLGPSIVSTTLRQDSVGALTFEETFEAQVDGGALCPSLRLDGTTLYMLSDQLGDSSQSCPVQLLIRSQGIPDARLEATLRSRCAETNQSTLANPNDTVSLDLTPLIRSGCQEAEIRISTTSGLSMVSAVFPILRQ